MASNEEIQKEIENYLGDANLAKDDFFRKKINEGGAGYVKLDVFLNRKNIKKMKINIKKLRLACKGSDEVELSKDGESVRRKGNKELPAVCS